MSFQQSYDRIAVLKVYDREILKIAGKPGKKLQNIDSVGTAFPSKQANGDPGFRIKFHVDKVTGNVPNPNPGVIFIWNLNATSRALVSKLQNLLVLEAGYGNNQQVIFKGNISYAVTKKEGPDYVTEIHAQDGLFAFQNSIVNQSFSQQTSASAIQTTLIGALKDAGIDPGIMKGKLTSNYNKGVVLSGKAIDELKKLFEKNNINWTIEDGKVNTIPYGGWLDKPIVILTPNTGLIGIPEQREKDAEKGALISFRCLLNPQLGTFQLITVTSKFVNGAFVTLKISHIGDTFGTEWYTEGQATGKNIGEAPPT